MRGYVDHVLALLPFEPAAHQRLGGPRCTYVGHPLIERLGEFRPNVLETARRAASPPILAVLPGSRASEVDRLMPPFGEAVALLAQRCGPLDVRLPTLPHVEAKVRAHLEAWRVQPTLVFGEAEKLALFRSARAALAASGTATLELALAGVPLVGAYRVSRLEALLRYVVVAPSILLPNLVLGERAIPELLQEACTPERLADALTPLIGDGPERTAQVAALAKLDGLMQLPGGIAPSEAAARATLETIAMRRTPLTEGEGRG